MSSRIPVKVTPGEQPVSIFFDGDDGKPWKPGKTAMRCLASIWSANAAKWIGMSCTIYNDESVTWGGAMVGGIRGRRRLGEVPDDVKSELGTGVYDQRIALETAAREHAANDADAAVDALNAAIAKA